MCSAPAPWSPGLTAMAAREVWTAKRWKQHRPLWLGMAAGWLALGVLYLMQDRFALGALYVAMAGLGVCLLAMAPLRAEADDSGMRIVWPPRSTYLPWNHIVDVRGNAGRWSEYLVVERPDGSLVNLPPGLTQDVIDRWRPIRGTTSAQASP